MKTKLHLTMLYHNGLLETLCFTNDTHYGFMFYNCNRKYQQFLEMKNL